MKAINSICIVSSNYPTNTDPICSFVEQIVNAFSHKGIYVTVVAPQSIVKHWLRRTELHPLKRKCEIKDGMPVIVYQPIVLSFGNRFERLNRKIRDWVIYKTLIKYDVKVDLCYGHFWHHAFSLYKYAKKNQIPLVAVTGESEISLHKIHKPEAIKEFLNYLSGVICVSSKNRDESLKAGLLIDSKKSIIIPNAIDDSLFYKMDKKYLRKKYDIDTSAFIVVYVGWFEHNKGVLRVSDAIKKLNDSRIKSFFIGDSRGEKRMAPNCKGILHLGRLPHNIIPDYLNMADVFVLPTLHEGCNNAIIEAMACGLPIISSNLPFNFDVMDETNSIKVNPMDVEEIANAIKDLFENEEKRRSLSEGALRTASMLTISKRADRIINFLESKL